MERHSCQWRVLVLHNLRSRRCQWRGTAVRGEVLSVERHSCQWRGTAVSGEAPSVDRHSSWPIGARGLQPVHEGACSRNGGMEAGARHAYAQILQGCGLHVGF